MAGRIHEAATNKPRNLAGVIFAGDYGTGRPRIFPGIYGKRRHFPGDLRDGQASDFPEVSTRRATVYKAASSELRWWWKGALRERAAARREI